KPLAVRPRFPRAAIRAQVKNSQLTSRSSVSNTAVVGRRKMKNDVNPQSPDKRGDNALELPARTLRGRDCDASPFGQPRVPAVHCTTWYGAADVVKGRVREKGTFGVVI